MSQKQEIAVSDGLSTYMLATSIYGHAQLMQQDLEHRPDGDKHQLQNAYELTHIGSNQLPTRVDIH